MFENDTADKLSDAEDQKGKLDMWMTKFNPALKQKNATLAKVEAKIEKVKKKIKKAKKEMKAAEEERKQKSKSWTSLLLGSSKNEGAESEGSDVSYSDEADEETDDENEP